MEPENSARELPEYQDRLTEHIGKKEQRKIIARQHDRSIWYGLGMFGLIGWSIALPTIGGIALGVWIDRTWKPEFSCTLMCLLAGVAVGCAIAWFWVKRESLEALQPEDTNTHEDHGT